MMWSFDGWPSITTPLERDHMPTHRPSPFVTDGDHVSKPLAGRTRRFLLDLEDAGLVITRARDID